MSWIERRRPLLWLTSREILRVTKLWTQTIAAPVIASFLFILVFGLSLGGRIKQIDGYHYDVFIVPGLITMAMVQAVFARGIDQGVLREDLPPEVLQELFGGLLIAAIKLVGERRLGLEEAAATTTALFLDGARLS